MKMHIERKGNKYTRKYKIEKKDVGLFVLNALTVIMFVLLVVVATVASV